MSIPWIKKYSPKSPDELLISKRLKEYIESYEKQKKKAILLYGPSGTGKTSAAYAFQDYEIIEINASDSRNKEAIEQMLGNAIAQKSLFFQKKLILIDDIDGISGKDRGAIQAIVKILEKSTFPIIITCQDPFIQKLSSLRSKCVLVECPEFSEETIKTILEKILADEKIEYKKEDLQQITKHAQGDLRAAINDIQLLSLEGRLVVPEEILERLKQTDIKKALKKIFKENPALDVFDTVSEDFDQILLWVDYNMPLEYREPQARARAYGCLTKADVFMRRIKRRQHWRFLIYINALLTKGISSSRASINPTPIAYTQTTRLLQIWQANRKYAIRKTIAEKIAKETHSSTKKVINDFGYYIEIAKKYNLGLDESEMEFIKAQ